MDDSLIISSTFSEMLPIFFALMYALIMGTVGLYLGKAILILFRRRG